MLRAIGIIAVVACIGMTSQASGLSTLYWDANGTMGGTGTWDTSTTNWRNVSTNGAANSTWTPNDGTVGAYFKTTAGTVTVGANVSVDCLTFFNVNETVNGSNTITLYNDAFIGVWNSGSYTATVNAPIASSIGMTKKGTGLLVLGGNNSGLQGDITHSAGALGVAADGALGAAGTSSSNRVILSAATTYLFFTNGVNFTTQKTIVGSGTTTNIVASNGNVLNTVGPNVTWDISASAGSTYGYACVGTPSTATADCLVWRGNIVRSNGAATNPFNINPTTSGVTATNGCLGAFIMDGNLDCGVATYVTNGIEILRNRYGWSQTGTTLNYVKPGAGLWLDPRGNTNPGLRGDIVSVSGFNGMDSSGGSFNGVPYAGGIRNVSGNNSFAGVVRSGTTSTTQYAIDAEDASSLDLKGGYQFANQAGTLTLQSNGAGALGIISGTIYDDGNAKPGGTNIGSIVKSGTGTWRLSTANTYIGPTSVTGGTLQVTNAAALGGGNNSYFALNAAGGTTTVSGGTIELDCGVTVNHPVTLNGGKLLNSTVGSTSTLDSGLSSVQFINGGTYTYPTGGLININGGGGSGGQISVSFGLTAASFDCISGGTNYHVGDVLTVTAAGSSTAQVTVTDNSLGVGGIAPGGWTLTKSSYNITGAPTAVSAMHGGAAATVVGNANNFAWACVKVSNAGSGYASAPTVSGNAVDTVLISSLKLAGTSNQLGGDGNLQINAVISDNGTGQGGFTKVGAGAVTLAATNTYTGLTTVSAGKIVVNGSVAGPVSVTGGALGGGGSIGGPLSINGGNLSPGSSPGSLTLLSRASFTSAADNYTVDINGLGVANYDNVLFKVAMSLNNATLVINDLNYKSSAALNDQFFIMDSDNSTAGAAISGTFNAGATTIYGASGIGYTVSYNVAGDPRGTLNDVLLTTSSLPGAAPEPATLFLMSTGALGVVAFIRRRRVK